MALKKSKFTEAQILFARKQPETGVAVAEVCRKMGNIGECCRMY
jgi:putative transposase